MGEGERQTRAIRDLKSEIGRWQYAQDNMVTKEAGPEEQLRRDAIVDHHLGEALAVIHEAAAKGGQAPELQGAVLTLWPILAKYFSEPRDIVNLSQAAAPILAGQLASWPTSPPGAAGQKLHRFVHPLNVSTWTTKDTTWYGLLTGKYDTVFHPSYRYEVWDQQDMLRFWRVGLRHVPAPLSGLRSSGSGRPQTIVFSKESVSGKWMLPRDQGHLAYFPPVAMSANQLCILTRKPNLWMRDPASATTRDLSALLEHGSFELNDGHDHSDPAHFATITSFCASPRLLCFGEVDHTLVTFDPVTLTTTTMAPHRQGVRYSTLSVLAIDARGVWAGGPDQGALSLLFFPTDPTQFKPEGMTVRGLHTTDGVPLDPHPPAPWAAAPNGRALYGFAGAMPVVRDIRGQWTTLFRRPPDPALEGSNLEAGRFVCIAANNTGCWAGTTRGFVRLTPGTVATPADVIRVGPVSALAENDRFLFVATTPLFLDLARRLDASPRRLLREAFDFQGSVTVHPKQYTSRRSALRSPEPDAIASTICVYDKEARQFLAWTAEFPHLVSSLAVSGNQLWISYAGSINSVAVQDISQLGPDAGKIANSSIEYMIARADKAIEDPALRTPLGWNAPTGDLPLPTNLLIDAVLTGHPEEIRALMPRMVDLDREGLGPNPLTLALLAGRFDAVEALLESGFPIKSDAGAAALRAAIQLGHESMVRRLVGLGASVESPKASDRQALDVAVIHGHREIASLLIEHGANPRGNPSTRHSPLGWALWKQDTAMIDLLVAAGANLNDADYKEQTLLAVAVAQDSLELLAHLEKLGLRWTPDSARATEAFEFAARFGAMHTLRALIARGVWSDNASEVAASHGHLRLARWLLDGRQTLRKTLTA